MPYNVSVLLMFSHHAFLSCAQLMNLIALILQFYFNERRISELYSFFYMSSTTKLMKLNYSFPKILDIRVEMRQIMTEDFIYQSL